MRQHSGERIFVFQLSLGKYGSPARAMTEASESTEKLLKDLWEAATNLRGVVGPAEYKHYVLPFIFLRFLSVKYEQRKRELENLAHDPKSDYYSKSRKFIQMTLDDIDEYRRVNAFIIPGKAHWNYLRKNAQSDNIKVLIDEALEALEEIIRTNLKRIGFDV